MPTTLPRTQITHVPRVQRILDVGRQRWPEKSPGAILVGLAEERANEIANEDTRQYWDGILQVQATKPGVLTSEMVADILDEDD